MASVANMLDGIWFDRPKVEDAEYAYHVYMAKGVKQSVKGVKKEAGGVAEQIAQAREKIHRTLQESDNSLSSEAAANLKKLESDNVELRRIVNTLVEKMTNMEARISKLETGGQKTTSTPAQPVQHHKPVENDDDDDDDDDEDIDLFGSDDEEDEETARIRQERLDAYHAKKSKKPAVTAKSTIVLDIKPWDDQTDMAELERSVRSVQTDGLVWGASKLVDVAFGIKKLQIGCVVEDDKVGTDFLEDNITGFDDLVQSMDIVAFNKI